MPIEAAPSSDEEEMGVLSDWTMAAEEEEETNVFTDWAMEETAVFPDWAMLDRIGRTRCHKDLDAARLVVSKNKTAARLRIDRGFSCYVSFTLAAPQGVSYLNLHWPLGEGSDTVYAQLRATDKDLVLFDIYDPSRIPYMGAPLALFVYTAAGPSPSVQRLPMYAKDRSKWRRFLKGKFTTGILRLSEKRFIVADLCVLDGGLCVFNSSETKEWKVIPITPGLIRWHTPEQNQSSSGQVPDVWSTDDVLAFDGRFLCWVDYFSGILLADFSSTIGSPALHFVPFPGEKEYPAELRAPRQFPGRFRNVSISQGKMRFVQIDNDFHETIEDEWPWRQLPEGRSQGQQPQPGPQKITIWTLNSDKFKWEPHGAINLDCLWAQRGYQALGIRQRLPEFPIVSVDDPDVLCCLLREEEFHGKGWMIVVDMKNANLRSCTPYINRHFYCAECVDAGCAECVDYKNEFPNVLLLPTVFSKHLERPTGMALDNDKVATRVAGKHKLKSSRFVSKKRKLRSAG